MSAKPNRRPARKKEPMQPQAKPKPAPKPTAIVNVVNKPEIIRPERSTAKLALVEQALLDEAAEIKLLQRFIDEQMREDYDYGVIPGTPKPALYKPGAEKLTSLYHCTAKFKIIGQVEDFDRYGGIGFFHFIYKARLWHRDLKIVVAEGDGSANSREGRYRWRNAERTCPVCKQSAIIKGKKEYGGGWICFRKKGGCGAVFDDRDPEIVDQPVGQVENEDVATLHNTILKMAEKRSHVGAALRLGRCSAMFTQDEDQVEPDPAAEHAAKASQPETSKPLPRPVTTGKPSPEPLNVDTAASQVRGPPKPLDDLFDNDPRPMSARIESTKDTIRELLLKAGYALPAVNTRLDGIKTLEDCRALEEKARQAVADQNRAAQEPGAQG